MNRNPMSNTGSPMFNIVQFIWAAAFFKFDQYGPIWDQYSVVLGKDLSSYKSISHLPFLQLTSQRWTFFIEGVNIKDSICSKVKNLYPYGHRIVTLFYF